MSRHRRPTRSRWIRLLALLVLTLATSLANYVALPLTPAHATTGTFANPLSTSGIDCCQDPTTFYKDGYYYYAYGEGESVVIQKSSTLEDVVAGPLARKVIALNPSFSSEGIWGPELFYASGNWYIYATYRISGSYPRQLFVMRADTQDPMGAWTNLGALAIPGWGTGAHHLDANLLTVGAAQYMIFSGNVGGDLVGWDGVYIAPLTNPSTLSATPVLIGRPGYAVATDASPSPTFSWEGTVQENPAAVVKNGKVNLVYSANDFQSTSYTTGLMTYTTGTITSPSSWTKKTTAIFNGTASVIGPGGASFTKSPSGTEDWIVYHAKIVSAYNGLRHAMAQKISFNASNEVVFGTPQGAAVSQNRPNGEPDTNRSHRMYFEAEDAALTHTGVPSARLYGSGFLAVGGLSFSDSAVTFNWVNVPNAGTYRVMIRYSTDWFQSATQPVYLNGSGTPVNVSLPSGNGWDDFKVASVDLTLIAGKNVVKLGNNAGKAEVDLIMLPRLEGEHGALSGTPAVTARTNAHNGSDVGNLNWPTDCVTQDIKVLALWGGTHTLRARASAGWGAATHAVTVNGASAGTLSYAGTVDWNTFTTATLSISMNAGWNTIKICKSGSGYAELDSFEWY